METTQTIPDWRATADEIWAILKETDLIVKENARGFAELRESQKESEKKSEREFAELRESQKENARGFAELRESQKETDRLVKENTRGFAELRESQKETDRIIKETALRQAERSAELDKKIERVTANVGGLNRSLGELIETLIAARLWEKFPEYGLVRAFQRVPIHDETNRVRTDIDILLSNTNKVMAVEVKRALDDKRDVDDHLKRMELIRQYPPLETINKQLLGAMAGGVVTPEIMRYAYEAGFYVLELTGESVHLVPPPAGFKPRQW